MLFAKKPRSISHWQRLDRYPARRDRMLPLINRFFRRGGMVLLNARMKGARHRPDDQVTDRRWPAAEDVRQRG